MFQYFKRSFKVSFSIIVVRWAHLRFNLTEITSFTRDLGHGSKTTWSQSLCKTECKFNSSSIRIISVNLKFRSSFPLFCRSNPPPQNLLYGVYLLNQNILQIKYLLGLKITEPRATLPNLLDILDGVPLDTTSTNLYQNLAPASSVSGSSSVDLNSSISNILGTGGLNSSPIEINGSRSRNR